MSQQKCTQQYLVTNPCLFPISFAQRITAQDLEIIRAYSSTIQPLEDTQFSYAPYSQKLQKQLRQSKEYRKHVFDFRTYMSPKSA